MNRFTVEETNLLSIYHEGSKAQLIENMTAALPYMDAGLRELAKRTLSKVNALTDAEYKELFACSINADASFILECFTRSLIKPPPSISKMPQFLALPNLSDRKSVV